MIDSRGTRLLLVLLVLGLLLAALGGGWAWDGPDNAAYLAGV